MRDAQPRTIFLKDYEAPAYGISHTALHFELFDDHTLVHAELRFERNAKAPADAALELNGVDLELLKLAIDGQALDMPVI